MQIAKFKVATLVATIILVGTISVHLGVALLMDSYIIPTSGSIDSTGPEPLSGARASESEIRAVFVHSSSLINPDFNLIAQTVKNAGANTLAVEIMGNNYAHYPSSYIPSGEIVLSDAISAAHANGLKIHVSMNVLLSALSDEYRCVTADGTIVDWTDPTKPETIALMKNLAEEIAQYDIDGFMFDYIRYDRDDVPFGLDAKALLEQYLGETITVFPGDFAPGGARHKEFLEWRTRPVNDLVKNMRDWMLAVNPDLEFSAAVFQYLHEGGQDYPTYWRMWIGQDWAYWVNEGYLDWVAPMMYTTDASLIGEYTRSSLQYGLGGPEGKIPLVPFLANAYPSTVDPNNLKQQIDAVRANGGDGWIIWSYGGPGNGQGSTAPDIRDYLAILDLPPVFTLTDIQVSIDTDVAITWTTSLPVTSVVEYSTSPLFNYTIGYVAFHDFNFYDINHIAGTIVEDTTPVTSHSVTLTNLQQGTVYYYRVQGQDQNGIATSKVYTFELESAL